MLRVNVETIRLFLHVLAAAVWVGGQLTLAGLVPGLCTLGPAVPRTVARRFNRIAWPATKRALAVWGGLSGLSALLALFYGVQLHG